MLKNLAFVGLSLITGLSVSEVYGQTNVNGTQNFVTTAVPFLRISPDARAGAMGETGIATTADPNAQYWNIAKVPFTDKNYGISATYTPWLKDLVPDIFLAYLSGYAKFGKDNKQAVSASMRYFSLGNINYTTATGDANGTGMPREYSFDLGYSQKLSDNLSVGASLRYIHSAIAAGVSYVGNGVDYRPGNAFAADLGVYYTKRQEIDADRANTFSFGAVASNLGSKISYNSSRKDFIPMNLGVGMSYTSDFDPYNALTFAVDLNKILVPPLDSGYDYSNMSIVSAMTNSFSKGDQIKEIDASLGLEYWYQHQFAVRAGYFYEDKSNGDRQYVTCGLGVHYNIFTLNASYIIPEGSGITRNPLSNTVRFSLLFEFDKLSTLISDDSSDSGSDDSSSK